MLADKITAWEGHVVQPKRKTCQDVINVRNELLDQYVYARDSIDRNGPPIIDALNARIVEPDGRRGPLAQAVRGIERDTAALTTTLKDAGIGAIVVRQ